MSHPCAFCHSSFCDCDPDEEGHCQFCSDCNGYDVMTNWIQQPREAVERAAAAGDTDAQTVLRIHERLDALDAGVQALKQDLLDADARLHDGLERLRKIIRAR